MKKILIILSLLLLLTACSSNTQELQEVEPEETTISLDSELQEPYYNLSQGETKEILGKEITINEIYSNGQIDFTINDNEFKLKETGSEEIFQNLWVTMISKGGTLKESYVVLKVEQFTLGDNQYLLERNILTKIQGKWFKIDESKSNGDVTIQVYSSPDSKSSESYSLNHGETIDVNGLSVTNVRNFYKIKQYAILEIKY